MSEKFMLNMMTFALAVGIILTWITWDPKVVICCMVLSVLRLGALLYEYPELTGRSGCKDWERERNELVGAF